MRIFILGFGVVAMTLSLNSCRKEAPKKSSQERREETLNKRNKELDALERFTASLRAVFTWRNDQPPAATDADRAAQARALSDKFAAAPVKDLPEDVAEAWQPVLKQWQSLAETLSKSPALSANELQGRQQEGQRAANALNQCLRKHGVMDLHF